MKRISVCMATYNGERFIKNQLLSILKQLNDDDEVIISDDSSTDNTIEIIKKLHDNRIVIYENNKFKNPIFNFENALNHATGELIFLSDQDDIWLEKKVEKFTSALLDCDLVLSDCAVIDHEENIIKPSFFKINFSAPGFLRNLIKNSYLGCCLAMRREVLNSVLPFPTNIPMHDWWIGLVCERRYKIQFLEEPLMLYRRHGVNATSTGEPSPFPIIKRLGFRINLLKNILRL